MNVKLKLNIRFEFDENKLFQFTNNNDEKPPTTTTTTPILCNFYYQNVEFLMDKFINTNENNEKLIIEKQEIKTISTIKILTNSEKYLLNQYCIRYGVDKSFYYKM